MTTAIEDLEGEASEVLGSIGLVKPLFEEPWQLPRSHGLLDFTCLCGKRSLMATIVFPDPRTQEQELAIWSLEGPRKHEVVATKRLDHHRDQKVTVMAIFNFEALDAFLLIQNPAVMHMLDTKDLRSLIEAPVPLHTRQLVCLAQCVGRSEIIIGCIDGKVAIYTLLMNKVLRTSDEASCVLREFNEYIVTCRLSWSLGGGLYFVRAFAIDEGWHHEGFRVFGIVDMNVMCWSWDTGAVLFKISNSYLSMRQRITCIEIRRDLPLLIAGFKDGNMCVWSIRPGSQGKVVESFAGHDAAVTGLKLDHRTGVVYSYDERAMLKCWDCMHGTLIHSLALDPEFDDDDMLRENPWASLELNPSPCRLALSSVDGRTVLVCRTPKHQEKVLEGLTHRRFFAKCESQVMWLRAVSSKSLMSSLRPAYHTRPLRPRTLRLPERGAGDHEVIIALCADGSLHMFHAANCELLQVVVLARRHELFVSGSADDGVPHVAQEQQQQHSNKEQKEQAQGKPQKETKQSRGSEGSKDNDDVSVGKVDEQDEGHTEVDADGVQHGMDQSIARATEGEARANDEGHGRVKGKGVTKGGRGKGKGSSFEGRIEREARKARKVVDDFRLRSNQLSKEQAADLAARNEKIRQEVDQRLQHTGKPDKQPPDTIAKRNAAAAVRDLGSVRVCELVADIGIPFGIDIGLLVLQWESGACDLVRLDTTECVQVYLEHERNDALPTCHAFLPHTQEEDMQDMDACKDSNVQNSDVQKTKTAAHAGKIISHTLVTGHSNGFIKIWSKTTVMPSCCLETLHVCETHEGGVVAVAAAGGVILPGHVSLHPTHMLVSTQWGPVGVYSAYTWQLLARVVIRDTPRQVADQLTSMVFYTPSLIIFCFADGLMKVWRFKLYIVKKREASPWELARTQAAASPMPNAVSSLSQSETPPRTTPRTTMDASAQLTLSSAAAAAASAIFRAAGNSRMLDYGRTTSVADNASRTSSSDSGSPRTLLHRSRSVKFLQSASDAVEGLSPLWPSGRKEEGDVEAMFAMQYGNTRVVECMPRFRKFITRCDACNMLEWGIREDNRGNVVITLVDQLSRDADIVTRRRGFGDIIHARYAAYLHMGSILIALALGDEINMICGGFKHMGSRYGEEDAARKDDASDEDDKRAEGRSRVKIQDSSASADEGMRDAAVASSESPNNEIAKKNKSIRRRGIFSDKFQTDLPTPRPDYQPPMEPELTEEQKQLKRLKQIVGPRMEQIGSITSLGVPPSPYTMRFARERGSDQNDVPKAVKGEVVMDKASLIQRTTSAPAPLPSDSEILRRPLSGMIRLLQAAEPSARERMRLRLRHANALSQEARLRSGPAHMWETVKRIEQGGMEDDADDQSEVKRKLWGGIACVDQEGMTDMLRCSQQSHAVDSFFNVRVAKRRANSSNLTSPHSSKTPSIASAAASCGRSSSLSVSSLGSAMSHSSFVNFGKPHPDPHHSTQSFSDLEIGGTKEKMLQPQKQRLCRPSTSLARPQAIRPISQLSHANISVLSRGSVSSHDSQPHTSLGRPRTAQVHHRQQHAAVFSRHLDTEAGLLSPQLSEASVHLLQTSTFEIACNSPMQEQSKSQVRRDKEAARKSAHGDKADVVRGIRGVSKGAHGGAKVKASNNGSAKRKGAGISTANGKGTVSGSSAEMMRHEGGGVLRASASSHGKLRIVGSVVPTDDNDRALLDALIHFGRKHLVKLTKILGRTRAQTPPARDRPEWGGEDADEAQQRARIADRLRFIKSLAPNLTLENSKLLPAET